MPGAGQRRVLSLDHWHKALKPNIHRTFSRLKREVGLRPRSQRCRPRLHDLRHRFAVNTLIDWYREDVDVQARLPVLSTYMGHVEPRDTYWYLSAAPELLGLVARRLESTIEQAGG